MERCDDLRAADCGDVTVLLDDDHDSGDRRDDDRARVTEEVLSVHARTNHRVQQLRGCLLAMTVRPCQLSVRRSLREMTEDGCNRVATGRRFITIMRLRSARFVVSLGAVKILRGVGVPGKHARADS